MGRSGKTWENSVDKKEGLISWGKVAIYQESFLLGKKRKSKVITRRYKYLPQSTAPTTTTSFNI